MVSLIEEDLKLFRHRLYPKNQKSTCSVKNVETSKMLVPISPKGESTHTFTSQSIFLLRLLLLKNNLLIVFLLHCFKVYLLYIKNDLPLSGKTINTSYLRKLLHEIPIRQNKKWKKLNINQQLSTSLLLTTKTKYQEQTELFSKNI